jgi:hypothetical protein
MCLDIESLQVGSIIDNLSIACYLNRSLIRKNTQKTWTHNCSSKTAICGDIKTVPHCRFPDYLLQWQVKTSIQSIYTALVCLTFNSLVTRTSYFILYTIIYRTIWVNESLYHAIQLTSSCSTFIVIFFVMAEHWSVDKPDMWIKWSGSMAAPVSWVAHRPNGSHRLGRIEALLCSGAVVIHKAWKFYYY